MEKENKKEYEIVLIEVLKFDEVINTNSFGDTSKLGDLPSNLFGEN